MVNKRIHRLPAKTFFITGLISIFLLILFHLKVSGSFAYNDYFSCDGNLIKNKETFNGGPVHDTADFSTFTSYDIIISNGKIIDGSGNPWYYGDIGIVSDKIVKIACLKDEKAKLRINAAEMFVTPGFIDIHTHSDNNILTIPTADNSVHQGLTTIVAGNCGGSPLPLGEFFEKVQNTGISINFISLVGHNSVRRKVMGSENRPPSEAELNEMKKLVAEAMQQGAFGLSTGLYYTPGNYAATEEIIELARIVSDYGGIYVSHLRDESDYNIGLIEAVKEAVFIGEAANIPVQISHLKCLGKPVWHKSDDILELIHKGREKGIDVRFDQYPYTASNTGLWGAVVPAWAQEGGSKMFFKKLEDPEISDKLRSGIQSNIVRRGGPGSLFILNEGKYLSELAESWGLDPTDAVIKIQREGGSSVISFNMTDYDLENIIQNPVGMIGSDGSISSKLKAGHPRAFGTFPRVFEVYVKEKKILTWEEAVRKMSSAPANRLGLTDRGLIRPGMIADLVIFNPETIRSKANYENPGEYPEGINYVIINGVPVIENGKHTGIRAGKVLRHQP